LDENSAAEITLSELARAAFVSPEHLCRLFQSATGRSPMQTVRLARLDRALILLARSNYSVAQIAHLNGFASPFHFSRKFKDAFGCAPQQLRAQLQNGATPPTPRLLQVLARTKNIKNGHISAKHESVESTRET
jgi:AraC-like DNA-binding protein